MSIIDLISEPSKLKSDLLKVTFFITLYENFKSNWEDTILSFYANSFRIEDGKVIYEFRRPNFQNPNAIKDGDFVLDKDSEERYKNEVFRSQKKKSGKGVDKEKSMFYWLLTREIITEEYYNILLDFRDFRNKLVHELDSLLNYGLPENMEEKINKLVEIRKYSSKTWFINFEYPTSGEYLYDDDGSIIIPKDAYSNVDLYFDVIYNALFK